MAFCLKNTNLCNVHGDEQDEHKVDNSFHTDTFYPTLICCLFGCVMMIEDTFGFFVFFCLYHMRNTNIPFPKSIKCLSNIRLMSADCLLNVLWFFIKYLLNVCWMSVECPRNICQMYSKFWDESGGFSVSYLIFEQATSRGFSRVGRIMKKSKVLLWNSQVKLSWIRLIGWTLGLLLHTGHKTQQYTDP